MKNPFRYGIIVDEPFFINREEEQSDFTGWLKSGQRIVLYSPRRYGKSSLILKVINNLKRNGYKTVYVDFFRVHSKTRFVELFYGEIINTMPAWEKAVQKINKFVRQIKPVVSLDDGGSPIVGLQYSATESSLDLKEVFDLPQQLADDKPWIVVFDEFQDIEKFNGDSFEKEMRSSLIHHDNVSYVFMGSQTHMLLNMFTHPNKAFYQFAKIVELKKISVDIMADYIVEQFRSSDISINRVNAEEIISIAENIPHYVQYLASAVWESIIETGQFAPDTISAAVTKILNNQLDYFSSIYHGLTPPQQKVLLALGKEAESIFTDDFKNRYNLSAVSTTQRAVERLIHLGIVEKVSGSYQFTDPFFKVWLKSI